MKLNPDCIRDILISIEDQPINSTLHLSDMCNLLPNYSEAEIFYTCKKLHEAQFINATIKQSMGLMDIEDLTYHGHQFIAEIRSDNIWSGVKNVAKQIGATSVSAFTQITSNIVAELIKSHFKLT